MTSIKANAVRAGLKDIYCFVCTIGRIDSGKYPQFSLDSLIYKVLLRLSPLAGEAHAWKARLGRAMYLIHVGSSVVAYFAF